MEEIAMSHETLTTAPVQPARTKRDDAEQIPFSFPTTGNTPVSPDESADTLPTLERAEERHLRELVRCDRPNRRKGKTRFRYKQANLADRAGYKARTTTWKALKGLREKVGIKWKKTGRSHLFEALPDLAYHILGLKPPPSEWTSDAQEKNNRSSENEHRNKAGLKDSLEEGVRSTSVPSPYPSVIFHFVVYEKTGKTYRCWS